jgi:cytochrome c oxidase subunit 1
MVTHESGGHNHPPTGFIRKYIFSLDHKIICIEYYFLALFSVFLGMALSLLMRIHLVWPNAKLPFTTGGIMTPEQYLALVTMHGTIMVFMVLTTAPQSGFGNYMLPIRIGAEDMTFPVLNMLSFWTTFVSLVVICSAFFVICRAPTGRLSWALRVQSPRC